MEEKRERQNRKQGKGPGLIWAIAIYMIMMVMINVSEEGFGGYMLAHVIVFAIVLSVIVFSVVRITKSVAKAKKGAEDGLVSARSSAGREPVRPSDARPVPTGPRTVSSQPQTAPAQTRPAPARVYNESVREENEVRDRQRRLRQLDDFYKNGIIDKEEYRVLRQRYQQESR